jgi:hypothetical protein
MRNCSPENGNKHGWANVNFKKAKKLSKSCQKVGKKSCQKMSNISSYLVETKIRQKPGAMVQ